MAKPDYKYYLKLDKWTKKEAALLISGIDPEPLKDFRFGYKINYEKYPTLDAAYKLYKLFQTVDFSLKYQDYCKHPLVYIHECEQRDWPLPEPLSLDAKAFNAEMKIKIINREGERVSLLKTIAALAMLYVDKQKAARLGDINHIKLSQVTEDILKFLAMNKIKAYGLGNSSLHARIRDGLLLLYGSLD